MDEAFAVKRFETYVSGIVPNDAVMHGLLRGVRIFVQILDKFLNGGQLEHEIIMEFWVKNLSSLAVIIRDADPWFNNKNAMFEEIAADFSRKVQEGVHERPEFLRKMDLYTNRGINL